VSVYACCCQCVPCRHQPRPCLLAYHGLCSSADTQHSVLLWHISLRCVYITLQRLLGQFVPAASAAAVAVCTMQAPCYDNSAIPTRAGLQGVSNTSPPRGGQLLTLPCCALAACACLQVTSCVLCVCVYSDLSTCLLGLERFSYGRGRSGPINMCCCISDYTSYSSCTV